MAKRASRSVETVRATDALRMPVKAASGDPSSFSAHGSAHLAPPSTITVRAVLTLRRRGGRKVVITPDGSLAWAPPRIQIDSALVKALARAHRWKHLLEIGRYASVEELARAEKINTSYLCRVLRLSLLAPDIVQAIVDGQQGPELQLKSLMSGLPVQWETQKRHFATR